MKEKTQYRYRAGALEYSRPRLKLMTLLLVLGLLALWLGAAPAIFASEQLGVHKEECTPGASPPDFTLVVTPASQVVEQEESATYTATVDLINCYTGTITLSVAGLPANSSYTLVPDVLYDYGDCTLTVNTTAETPPGDYTLVLSGESGDLYHEAAVNLTVTTPPPPEPFFTVEVVSEGSQSVVVGNGASYTISLGIRDSLANTVLLPVSLSVDGLPAGAGATFDPDTLTPPGDSVLSVSTAESTPAGTHELTVNADSGEMHAEISLYLIVEEPAPPEPFFTIAVSPDSQAVTAGAGVDYAVSVQGDGGTAALPVSLSVAGLPAGAEATFDPASVTSPGDSTLSISTTANTPIGTCELTVSGDSGAMHNEASVFLVVQPDPGSQAVVSIVPDSDSLFVGETTESQVVLGNAHDFYGIEFFISYDPSVVQVVDADPGLAGVQIAMGELFPPNQYTVGVNEVDTGAGLISFGVARLAPLPAVDGGGALALITWEAVGEGQSPLDFTHLKLAAPSGFELAATSQGGVIEVTQTGELNGAAHMQGRLNHSGAEVNVEPVGLQAITDIQGLFNFLTHGLLTVTARMYGYLDAQATVQVDPGASVDLGPTTLYGGEVTGDNLIDILDLAYLGARFHTDDLSADINADGLVDILDLVLAAANFMMSGPTPWAE
jgi:hypothetical protein